MIIDCHGHYTTAPKSLERFRQRQIEGLKDPALSPARDSLLLEVIPADNILHGAATFP